MSKGVEIILLSLTGKQALNPGFLKADELGKLETSPPLHMQVRTTTPPPVSPT